MQYTVSASHEGVAFNCKKCKTNLVYDRGFLVEKKPPASLGPSPVVMFVIGAIVGVYGFIAMFASMASVTAIGGVENFGSLARMQARVAANGLIMVVGAILLSSGWKKL